MRLNANTRRGHVVVIGAGTMGSGLATHFANVGWNVTLLDVDDLAKTAVERMIKGGQFYLSEYAKRITPGNVETDLDRVRDADWVVEAIIEQIEAKRTLLSQLAERVPPDVLVSTNTSGLGIGEMSSHLPNDLQARFLGTHFFNPPRVMKLLELIPTGRTHPEITDGFIAFGERVLGKRVVIAKDRPGFITTRVGIYAKVCALSSAIKHGITPESADVLLGPFIGRPRSGVFRLADLVGLDISVNIMRNQKSRLPDDPYLQAFKMPAIVERMVAEGRLGEKSGGGFYRREGKQIFTLDFETLDYRPRQEPELPIDPAIYHAPLAERVRTALNLPDPYGTFVREAFLMPIAYVADIADEIAHDLVAIDRGMKMGYNWELGPFEYLDAIGLETAVQHLSNVPTAPSTEPEMIKRVRAAGLRAFYQKTNSEQSYFQSKEGGGEYVSLPVQRDFIVLSDLKAAGKSVMQTVEGSAIDLGDGVLCLEFQTKANVLTPSLMEFCDRVRERAERDFAALVIGNQGSMFSAGFNLNLFLEYIGKEDWTGLEEGLRLLQGLGLRLKYSNVPVVAAVQGYALGGGCEVMLHCHHVHAFAESGIGLPEALVGLMPAGGGTTLLTARASQNLPDGDDPLPHLKPIFMTLSQGKRSNNAHEARQLGFLTPCDSIGRSADRLLYGAKKRARALAEGGFEPPHPKPIPVLGEEGFARLMMEVYWAHEAGQITDHDRFIAEKIAYVMTGGRLKTRAEVSEEYLHELEREVFVQLCRTQATVARIQQMLETGKPLRN